MTTGWDESAETIEKCILCGSESSEIQFSCEDRLYRLPGVFGLVRCSGCSLYRLTPRPASKDLPYYYPEDGYHSYQRPGVSALTVKNRGRLGGLRDAIRLSALRSLGYPVSTTSGWQLVVARTAAGIFRNRALYGLSYCFPPYFPEGRALDIGCGNGAYLSYLKPHGWQVIGVDVSSRAAEVAKSVFDIDVFVGELNDVPFSSESFDFVHMSHVIEHMTEPIETLKRIAELLKPGRVVYIETPNVDSDGFKAMGKYWFPLEAPRHIYLFSPDTLREALHRAGLRTTRIWTTVFPGAFSWEDTYKQEEILGTLLPSRPKLRKTQIPRALTKLMASRIRHAFNAFNGDILHVWAMRPIE
jgi:SAM-dependent methyltransferase